MKASESENGISIPFSLAEVDSSISKRFQIVARLVPERVALDVLSDRLTYAQLDELSDRIAWAIAKRNVALQAAISIIATPLIRQPACSAYRWNSAFAIAVGGFYVAHRQFHP